MTSVWTELMDLPVRQEYRHVAGRRIRCLSAGSGAPLVMLHSGGGFAESYARNIAAHAGHFRVYVPDLPGFGLSQDTPEEPTLTDLVTFVGQFQESIDTAEMHLVGTSVGAWVAAMYAGSHPGRVTRLVLNCGVPLRPNDAGVDEFVQRGEREEHAVTENELRESNRSTFAHLFSREEDISGELLELSYQLNWQPERAPRTRRLIGSLLGEMIFDTEISRVLGPQALKSISCPTLLIWARQNPGQSLELANKALNLLADGILWVCEDAGHWPQWESAETYNRAQLEFLLGGSRATWHHGPMVRAGRSVDVDVAIVGYGPVGAVAANLLGRNGLRVAVFDQSKDIYDKPRAVVLDHEALRVLQMCRLPGDIGELFHPYPGSHYVGVDGEIIRRFYPTPPPHPLGWPSSASFVQPEVEALLRRGVDQLPTVKVYLEHELRSAESSGTSATATLRDPQGGTDVTVNASYLLGCDGGKSTVRRTIGTGFDDLAFDEEWLVIDAWLNRPARLPELSIQYCQPSRPATYIVGPRNLRRWELKLMPGERSESFRSEADVHRVLKDYVDVKAIDLWRFTVYRFHALVAQTWRRNRIFLLGDAAHQTPPFTGQGLCSGIRDAANLAWKIQHVSQLQASTQLLDTYEAERKPHFRAIVERSKGVGEIVGELDPQAASARDRRMRQEMAEGHSEISRQSGIPPLKGGLVARTASGEPLPLAGSLFIQPRVSDGTGNQLLEDVVPQRFLLLAKTPEPFEWFDTQASSLWKKLEAQKVLLRPRSGHAPGLPEGDALCLSDTDGAFQEWLGNAGAAAVIVRPDRYVYGLIDGPASLRDLARQLARALTGPTSQP